jgi:hypothetical protein
VILNASRQGCLNFAAINLAPAVPVKVVLQRAGRKFKDPNLTVEKLEAASKWYDNHRAPGESMERAAEVHGVPLSSLRHFRRNRSRRDRGFDLRGQNPQAPDASTLCANEYYEANGKQVSISDAAKMFKIDPGKLERFRANRRKTILKNQRNKVKGAMKS